MKLFKYLFLLTIFITPLSAEVINKVKVYGNSRISEESIKIYGEINIGENYSKENLNQIIKNLYETNFFENIEVTIIQDVLNVKVSEYPMINDIEFKGEKSSSVKNQILDKLQLQPKQSFIQSKLNEDIELLKKLYSNLGFNFIKVVPKIEKFSENRVNLIYDLQKGNKSYIKKINFNGEKVLKESTLIEVIASEEKKFWKIFSKNTYLSLSNVELDKRLLLNFYKNLGYYDVQVLSNQAILKENDFIELTYTINAGKRFKIKKIITNVDEVYDKKIFEPLIKNYSKLAGKYYSPFKVKKLLDEVDLLIAKNDLQFVEHSVNEIIEGSDILIQVNIYEGKKELVEKINIYGNNITNEAVIRSELLLDEGDPFNKLKLDQSLAKIKSRNIFGEVTNKIKEGTNLNQKIIEINVDEKPTGEISAGAGFGTNGGTLMFDISENNWLGEGINLKSGFKFDDESLSIEFGATNPNYNFSGNSLSYWISNTSNDKPDSGYKNNIFTSGIGTTFEQFRNIYFSPNLIISHDNLKVLSNASDSLKKQKGSFTDLALDYSIASDTRDRAFNPSEGRIISFGQNLPVYADSPHIQNSLNISSYHTLTNNLVGSAKAYLASVNGLNNEDVRLSKRLYLSNYKLRGFQAGKVGPIDGKDYVGGNYAATVNFEANLPNLLPEATNTDVSVFLDFGNLWGVDYNKSIDETNKLRSTTGVNLNFLSPVGPMSFVFSQNISKAKTDKTESFNFRLGTTF